MKTPAAAGNTVDESMRVNRNGEVVDHKTKIMSLRMLKSSEEQEGIAQLSAYPQ